MHYAHEHRSRREVRQLATSRHSHPHPRHSNSDSDSTHWDPPTHTHARGKQAANKRAAVARPRPRKVAYSNDNTPRFFLFSLPVPAYCLLWFASSSSPGVDVGFACVASRADSYPQLPCPLRPPPPFVLVLVFGQRVIRLVPLNLTYHCTVFVFWLTSPCDRARMRDVALVS